MNNCFSDSAHKNTYASQYLSITGSGCEDYFSQVCVNVTPGTDQ